MILNFPIGLSDSTLIAQARQQRDELVAQLGEVEQLEHELFAQRQDTPPWAANKARQWEVEELLPDALQMLCEQTEAVVEQYEQLLSGADVQSETTTVRDEFLALCWKLLMRAEERGERRQARRFERLLSRHDVGQYAPLIEGAASLSIESEPVGARARLYEMTGKAGRIVRGERRELGKTPVTAGDLRPGRYLLELRLAGKALVRRPLLLGRGSEVQLFIRLFNNRRVGADFVQIGAGRFAFGGDRQARCAHQPTEPFVDNFAIARQLVTVGEYLLFLDDLAGRDPDLAIAFTPRQAAGSDPRLPITNVTLQAARAYCDWVSANTGVTHRLPTEQQWEKAARGVDGRIYPWGNHFDPTFCQTRDSEQRPRLRPVGSFSDDISPYGVVDLGGAVAEWTESIFGGSELADCQEDRLMVVRGGSFLQGENASRCASRRPVAASQQLPDVGFRMVRPLDVGGGERVVPATVPVMRSASTSELRRPSLEEAHRELLAICRNLVDREPEQALSDLLAVVIRQVTAERALLLQRHDALSVRCCCNAAGEAVPLTDQSYDEQAVIAAFDQQRVISLQGDRPMLALPVTHHSRRFCLLLERRFAAHPFNDTDRLLAEMGADLLAMPLQMDLVSRSRRSPVVGQTLSEAVGEVERDLIRRTLVAEAGNISRTAKRLGLSRNGLRACIRRHSLS